MRMLRSLVVGCIALAAMAISSVIPAVAATPTDPGIYEAVKASIETPAVLVRSADHLAIVAEAPSAGRSRADGRSFPLGQLMNVAGTPATVDAYKHIDPDIRC